MRVLLDECVPRKVRNALCGHECQTVPEAGFAGKKNGQLLTLAENSGWEAFVTMDKGIEYQQNLQGRRIAIILLRAKSNRLIDLLPLMPRCLEAQLSIQQGDVVRLV
jgi:hypothetical protein